MPNTNKSNRIRTIGKPWRLYTAISIIGIIFVIMMFRGSKKAVHLIKEHSTLFNAISKTENEINDANIWYSAVFSDKDNNMITKAEKHIDEAQRYFKTLTKQDTIENVIYYPLDEETFIDSIKNIIIQIKDIKVLGKKYFASKLKTGKADGMPREQSAIMNKLSKSIENLTVSVRTVTAKELNNFETTRSMIILLFIIFQILLLISVYVYNKHRKEDYVLIDDSYKKLQETNVNLEIAEQLIRESETQYRTLVNKAPIGIHELDKNGNFISLNEACIRVRDFTNTEEIINSSYFDFVCKGDEERVKSLFYDALNGKSSEFEYRLKNDKEQTQTLMASFIPLVEENGIISKVMGVTQDITEIRTSQDKLAKANILYSILSEINQAIVRTENITELYNKICKIFVEYGKFKFAWIGLFDSEIKNFNLAAFYGSSKNYTNKLSFVKEDLKGESLKIANKILGNQIVILNPIYGKQRETIWRESAIDSGFVSGAVVPISLQSKVIGAFSVNSAEENYFGTEEESLLKEISADIAFAIEKNESENKRKHAEEAILNIEKGISTAVGGEFFDLVVESLNNTIGAYTTYLGELNTNKNEIKLLSIFGTEKLSKNMSYNLNGTPCEFVVSDGKLLVNGNLSTKFPNDKLLSEMKIESYFGLRLEDSNGNTIGIIVSLYTEKIKEEDFVHRIYNIFGARAASELERKYTFDSLMSSEKRYEKLYEQSNDAIYLLYNNKFEIINKKFTELFGYTIDEVNSEDFNFMKLVSPKSMNIIEDRIKRSMNREKLSPIYEFTALSKEGKEIECETSVTYLDFKEGKATQGIIRDITERKLAIEEIKNSEKSYRELFDNSEDAIYMQNNVGEFVAVNQGAVKMYGYPREYFIGKTPEFLSAPGKNDLTAVQEMIIKAWNGEPQSFEFWGLRKNGEEFPKEVRLRKGTYWGEDVVIAFARDITEKKLKDELISISELRYRSLFEASADGILLLKDSNFVDCNPKMLTMLGCSRDQLIGKSMTDFFPDSQLDGKSSSEKSREIIKQCINGESPNIEWEFVKYDGTHFSADVHLSSIKLFDEILIIAIIHDITEKKKAEAELIQAREMAETSDKLKSEFLAQMSHEIRTPINTVLSFSSLIKFELEEQVSDDLKESFNGIENAGRRIIRTIDLILNMSELQANSYDFRPKVINLQKDIFEKLEAENQPFAEQAGISLSFEESKEDIFVFADEYTLNQIFSNIIDNAIKYTKKGEVKLFSTRKDSLVSIHIKDSGIGISEEYLPKLFDAFSQEEQGYTRSFEGNGLGLSLVKEYCDMNQAEIYVQSKKGKGTIFTVTFNLYKGN